nr:MAG TPA: hypothetical protein [Caudoviricetes sp.]
MIIPIEDYPLMGIFFCLVSAIILFFVQIDY